MTAQHANVGKLTETIKSKVVGGVLFGDTRNVQDSGKVPGYPEDKTRCSALKRMVSVSVVFTLRLLMGTLCIRLWEWDQAVRFLKGKIDASG
jgi:hypothetical protein